MQLFERRLEFWSFLLVILCLVGALTQVNQPNFLSVDSARQFKIIVELVLGNSIHVVISYYFLFTLPEMKSWLSEKLKDRLFLAFLSFVLVCLASLVFILKFITPEKISKDIWVLLKFAWIFIPVFHAWRQVVGIATMYDMASPTSARHIVFEKRLFRIFEVFLFIQVCLLAMNNRYFDDSNTTRMIRLGVFVPHLLIGLYLIGSNFRNKYKCLFMTRALLFPLTFYSSIAGMAIAGSHGFDYYMVAQKIRKNTSAAGPLPMSVLTTSIAVFLILSFILNAHAGIAAFFLRGKAPDLLAYKIMNAVMFLFAYGHYYLEGVLYKMRDPTSRKFIGPLLR